MVIGDSSVSQEERIRTFPTEIPLLSAIAGMPQTSRAGIPKTTGCIHQVAESLRRADALTIISSVEYECISQVVWFRGSVRSRLRK